MKLLLLTLALALACIVSGCTNTTRAGVAVDPGISASGSLCAFGVCLTPQVGVAATIPVVPVPVATASTIYQPPVQMAYVQPAPVLGPFPPARSYNEGPLPVRPALEK